MTGLDLGSIYVGLEGKFDKQGFAAFERASKGAEKQAKHSAKSIDNTASSFKDADKHSRAASKGFSVAGAAATAAAGAIGVGLYKGLSLAVSEARDGQVVGRETARVIKTMGNQAHITAKQVGDLSTAISNKTGIDDEAIQKGQNLLLTFGNIRNEVGKGKDIFNQASSAMADYAQVFTKGNLDTAAIQLGKALQDPVKGAAALKRTGSMNDTDIAALKKAAEAGASRIQLQQMVLKAINEQVKGAAAAASTPMQKLQTTFNNLAENIGTQLLPYIDKAAKSITKFLTQMMNGTGEGGKFAKQLKEMAKEIKPIIEGIPAAAKWAVTAITWLAKAFKFVGTIAGKQMYIVYTAVTSVISAVKKAASWVKNAFHNAFNAVRTAINTVKNAFSSIFNTVRNVVKKASTVIYNIRDALLQAFRPIGTIIGKVAYGIYSAFNSTWGFIKKLPGRIFNAFKSIPGRILSVFTGLGKKIMNTVGDLPSGAFNAVKGVLGFAKGGHVQGAQLYVAGEAGKETILSDNPSYRKQNMQYAKEWAQRNNVPMFAKGGTVEGGRSKVGHLKARANSLSTKLDLDTRRYGITGGVTTPKEAADLQQTRKALLSTMKSEKSALANLLEAYSRDIASVSKQYGNVSTHGLKGKALAAAQRRKTGLGDKLDKLKSQRNDYKSQYSDLTGSISNSKLDVLEAKTNAKTDAAQTALDAITQTPQDAIISKAEMDAALALGTVSTADDLLAAATISKAKKDKLAILQGRYSTVTDPAQKQALQEAITSLASDVYSGNGDTGASAMTQQYSFNNSALDIVRNYGSNIKTATQLGTSAAPQVQSGNTSKQVVINNHYQKPPESVHLWNQDMLRKSRVAFS